MRRLIHAVRGWISGGTSHTGRNPAFVYTYPLGKDTPNGEVNANDQIAILRRLSTFVSKENTPVTIIFPGRPSRKIPDGTSQGGVKVRYATGDQLQKTALSALSEAKRTHSPVLATNHPELEKVANKAHFRHIRASTLEETLDVVCGPLRREQQPPQPQRRQPQPQTPPPQQDGKPAPQQQPEAIEPISVEVAQPEPPVKETEQAEPGDTRPDPMARRLHRHEPSKKIEIKDQAILDLIDPL